MNTTSGNTRKLVIAWNTRRNTIVLGGKRGFTPRGDIWLALHGERRLLADTIERELGVSEEHALAIAREPVLFHRIPAPRGEYAVEVRAHGLKIGSLELDPSTGFWMLHATGALASLLDSLGVEAVNVESSRGRRLKGSKITLRDCTGRRLALIVAGSYAGIARRVKECIFKVRDLAPRGFKVFEPVPLQDQALTNRSYIERLVSEAVNFIRLQAANKDMVYVAVSGGIDSSVAAFLTVRALGSRRVRLVYADTGMEFPESFETVEKLADRLGVDLDIVEAPYSPLVEISRRGLMSRDNRWCTKLLKLEGLRRYYEKRRAQIIVEGTRALESTLRASLPRKGVNPVIPGVERLLPILYWSRLEVQLTAILYNIPVNPLYELGFTRIGCMICPAMNLYELRLASSLYPVFYSNVARVIEPPENQESMEFILKGLWRTRETTWENRRWERRS